MYNVHLYTLSFDLTLTLIQNIAKYSQFCYVIVYLNCIFNNSHNLGYEYIIIIMNKNN